MEANMKSAFLKILIITAISGTILSAEETAAKTDPGGWKVSVNSNLTLTLNSYSDNWTGGELGSAAWAAQLNTRAEKQLNPKLHNQNTLKLAFGQTEVQQKDSLGDKHWSAPEKSTDLIDLESLLRFTLKAFVDPYIGVRIVSQFQDGADPADKKYVNPVEITESFGAAKTMIKKENTNWDSRLGLAVRQTVNRPEPVTNDGGFELVSEFKSTNKDKWMTFSSQLKAYEAVFSSAADETAGTPQENYWRYPDINWENTLAINLTKYIMLNLYAQMLYDREISEDPRLKETLSAGLTYTFQNF